VAAKRPNIEPERGAPGARREARGPRNPREDALASIHMGHTYLQSDSFTDAIGYFTQAERAGPLTALTVEEVAGLYASIARCHLGLGDHDAARGYVKRIDDLGTRGRETEGWAEAQVVLAKTETKAGQFHEALEAAEKAYGVLRHGTDTPLLAEASKALGTAHAELGDVTAARDCFVDCLVCNKRLGNEAGMAGAYNNLGILAKRSGDLPAAVEYFERALEIDEKIGRPAAIARRLNNLGVALYRLSRWDDAERHLSRAWEIYSRLGAVRDVVAVESALGNVHRVRRDWGKAREHFERVLRTSRDAGYRRSEALALEFLGDLEADRGNYDEALAVLDEALAVAHRLSASSDVIGEVLRRRAEVLLALGRREEAEKDCEDALGLTQRIGDRIEEGATLRVLMRIAFARGKRAAGESLLREAEDILRRTGESFELARTALDHAVGLRDSSAVDELFLERIEARLSIAESHFVRIGADYWAGRCRLERAKLLHKAGRAARTRTWIGRARPLLERVGDDEGLSELEGLAVELDEELAAVGDAPPSTYSVIADGYRYIQTTEPDVAVLHRFASDVAEAVGVDRLALFALEDGATPLVTTTVDRTGRRLAEVRRLVRFVASGPSPIRPLVTGAGALGGLVPSCVETVAVIPVGPPESSGVDYVLYADRLKGAHAAAFRPDDVEFMAAAARMLGTIHSEIAAGVVSADGQDEARPAASSTRFITSDARMLEILDSLSRLRDSSIPILILGESGAGKEVLARTIHEGGRSRTGRLVALNSGAIAPHLQESELFGHVKGAFTDADRDREGLIAAAAGGTLFLDEIGEMSPELQVKLLRFLQSGEYRRVGESVIRTSNARVISASNRDLREETGAGRFRRDLFYRLSAFVVRVPPLRDRAQDVPVLMEHFLKLYARLEGKRVRGFTDDVRELFMRHDWRGNNVRELENEIRRGVALCEDGALIGIDSLRPELAAKREAIRRSNGNGGPHFATLKDEVEALERSRIAEALERCDDSKRKAAKVLGLSRTGLYTKLRKYGMD